MKRCISTAGEWRRFETELWASAQSSKGLRLRSLDPEQRRAIVDRAWSRLRLNFPEVYFGRYDGFKTSRFVTMLILLIAAFFLGSLCTKIQSTPGRATVPPVKHVNSHLQIAAMEGLNF